MPAVAQKAVFLVRHAEKADQSSMAKSMDPGDDPPLSVAGVARAESLERHLRDAGITAIVTSEYLRTKQTAAPLAKALKLEPAVIPARGGAELLAHLRSLKNDVVLVVGHSNTVPRLVQALGGAADVTIAETEFDNLFVVVPAREGPATVLRLRY
jgi:broad specificity phosphatase PhoE